MRARRPLRTAGGRPPAPGRDALIAAVAEAMLLDRAVPTLLDADAHAVTVTISRLGGAPSGGGVPIVARALAQPAWFDDGALVHGAGVRAIAEASLPLVSDATRDLVLVLRGLFVRAALDGEHGTWVVRGAAAEPDMVRVHVQPGAPRSAADALRAHLAARHELERVLEAGGALPPNPDVLLPVTRSIVVRPPLRAGEPFGVEIEDFSTGWVDKGLYRDVPTALRRAWHLAWSRVA